MKRRTFTSLLLGGAAILPLRPVLAQDAAAQTVVVGVQLSGTAKWEMEVIQTRGLDREHGFVLELVDVADKQAGHVALMSGAADIILSDYIWVASLRTAGEDLVAVPHSLAVGGLIVPAGSEIASVEDLPGRKIGVAGGPQDKSWIILQAYYRSLTGETLADKVQADFGAPPLVNELLAEGQIDAGLNFWHFNARAKAAGMTEVVTVAEMLEGMGMETVPPLLTWVFREETAAAKEDAIRAFLDASFAAKRILATDDAAWEELRGTMGVEGDEALFAQLRDDYRRGIVSELSPELYQAAEEAFGMMAEFGGPELVGESEAMDQGTFWKGYTS